MDKEQQADYQQAQRLLAEEKWNQASDILEALLNEVEDPHLARLTIYSLYRAHLFTRASVYVFEYLEILITNFDDAKMAIEIFLESEFYIAARLAVVRLPGEWQEKLMPLIQEKEAQAHQNFRETLQLRLKDFYHLGDQGLYEQQDRLQAAYKLPLQEFVTGAKFILRDPFSHPLVKSSIVELLCKLKVSEQVTILWLDQQEYQIRPIELLPLSLHPVVLAGKEVIRQRLGDNNPQQEQLALQEFQLQVMFLYPRIETVITDIARWIDIIIAHINDEDVSVSDAEEKWQEKLTQLINELMEKH